MTWTLSPFDLPAVTVRLVKMKPEALRPVTNITCTLKLKSSMRHPASMKRMSTRISNSRASMESERTHRGSHDHHFKVAYY